MAASPPDDDPRGWNADPLTIGGSLIATARRWPESDALVFDGRRASYAALLDEAVPWARMLVGAGMKPGDHVGILMPNAFEFIVLVYAIAFAGGRAVPLNARYREADLGYTIAKADLRFLVIGGQAKGYADYRRLLLAIYPELASWDGRSRLALPAAPKLETVFNIADPDERVWPTEADRDRLAAAAPAGEIRRRAEAVSPDAVSLLIFSSGTTAEPKACMLTHRSLSLVGRALAGRFRMTEDDRFWDPLPFFHMSAMLPLAACRAAGSAFLSTAHAEPGAALKTLEEEQATIAYSVFPTITTGLVTHPDFSTRDLSAIRIMVNVGPKDLLRRYRAALPQARHVSCYGLTEATGVPFYGDPDDTDEELLDSCGPPFPGIEVRIVEPQTGAVLPAGEPGEIQLRGYCLFSGYHADPERTAEAFTEDGWLRTGDRGFLKPSGLICYVGRFKDMLKIGGENVAAQEIEGFLSTHPAVQIAQVVGVPDDDLMEVAAAFIETRPGASVEPEALVHHCAGRIASYKIPRYIRFVRDWPMSSTKIQKFKLREGFEPEGKLDVRALLRG